MKKATGELVPLQAIRDNYEKAVLSMDKTYITDYEGCIRPRFHLWWESKKELFHLKLVFSNSCRSEICYSRVLVWH
jgi:hypothetical protein